MTAEALQEIASQQTAVMPAVAAAPAAGTTPPPPGERRTNKPLLVAVPVAAAAVVVALVVAFAPFSPVKASDDDTQAKAPAEQAADDGQSAEETKPETTSAQSNASKMYAGASRESGLHTKTNVRVGGEMATLDYYSKDGAFYLDVDYSDGQGGYRQIYIRPSGESETYYLDPETMVSSVVTPGDGYGLDVCDSALNIQEGLYSLSTWGAPDAKGTASINGANYKTEEFERVGRIEKIAFTDDGTPAYYIFSTGDGTGDYVARIDAADGNIPDGQFEIPAGYVDEATLMAGQDSIEDTVYAGEPDDGDEYPFVSSACSSELEPDSVTSYYGAANVVDEDVSTAWNEGMSGDGSGQWVEVGADGDYYVEHVYIMGGYNKSDELYWANNRPRQVTLQFSDGSTEQFELADSPNQLQQLVLSEPKYTSSVRVWIDSVYKGTKYDDCCITEIIVTEDPYVMMRYDLG